MPMPSARQFERLMRMDEWIRSGQARSIGQLAQKLEVSPRTISTDTDFLRDQLKAPLEFERGGRGWYYTDPQWRLPLVPSARGNCLPSFWEAACSKRRRGQPIPRSCSPLSIGWCGGCPIKPGRTCRRSSKSASSSAPGPYRSQSRSLAQTHRGKPGQSRGRDDLLYRLAQQPLDSQI